MDGGMEIVDAHMHLWTPATHPWLESVRNRGHPAGKFGEQVNPARNAIRITLLQSIAAIMTYTLEDYLNDIKGFNVTHAVHVEAVWPGDPVGETK